MGHSYCSASTSNCWRCAREVVMPVGLCKVLMLSHTPLYKSGDSGQKLDIAFRPDRLRTAIWLYFSGYEGNCSTGLISTRTFRHAYSLRSLLVYAFMPPARSTPTFDTTLIASRMKTTLITVLATCARNHCLTPSTFNRGVLAAKFYGLSICFLGFAPMYLITVVVLICT